jgi:hypothetical protein
VSSADRERSADLPDRLFSRLPTGTRPGEVVQLVGTPGWWEVETAKPSDDLRDAKCVLVRVADRDQPCPTRCYENTRAHMDGPTMVAGQICPECGGAGVVAAGQKGRSA